MHSDSRRRFVKKSLAASIVASQPTILAGLVRADGGGGGTTGTGTTDPWETTSPGTTTPYTTSDPWQTTAPVTTVEETTETPSGPWKAKVTKVAPSPIVDTVTVQIEGEPYMVILTYHYQSVYNPVWWNYKTYYTHFEAALSKKMATDPVEGPYTAKQTASTVAQEAVSSKRQVDAYCDPIDGQLLENSGGSILQTGAHNISYVKDGITYWLEMSGIIKGTTEIWTHAMLTRDKCTATLKNTSTNEIVATVSANKNFAVGYWHPSAVPATPGSQTSGIPDDPATPEDESEIHPNAARLGCFVRSESSDVQQ